MAIHKILVVDDQLTIRSLARSTLQQLGFTDITDSQPLSGVEIAINVNRAEAARSLGIARPQLYAKLDEHGLGKRGERDEG